MKSKFENWSDERLLKRYGCINRMLGKSLAAEFQSKEQKIFQRKMYGDRNLIKKEILRRMVKE